MSDLERLPARHVRDQLEPVAEAEALGPVAVGRPNVADDARNRVDLAGAFARAPEIMNALEAASSVDRLDEARIPAKEALAIDPTFTIRRYRAGAPSDNPVFLAGRQRIYELMRKVGVPEG